MNPQLRNLALLAAFLLPACDSGSGDEGDGDGGPNVDCSTAAVPKFSEMTAWAKCTNCHSSTLAPAARGSAPTGIDFDTVDTARKWAQAAMNEVYAGSMPLGATMSEDEKTQIYNWASCDTPN